MSHRSTLGLLALGITIVLSGCGKGPTTQSHTPIVAKIPPGAKMHDVDLESATWNLSPAFRRATGSKGSSSYVYVGTGSPNASDAVTTTVPIKPGRIYVFSARVNPSNLLAGDFDLLIDTSDGKSTYATNFSPGGPPARFSTAPWLAPPGVTRVMLVMQLVGATVAKGEQLTFAGPRLSDTAGTLSSKS